MLGLAGIPLPVILFSLFHGSALKPLYFRTKHTDIIKENVRKQHKNHSSTNQLDIITANNEHTQRNSKKKNLYFCGWNPNGWVSLVFPDYDNKQFWNETFQPASQPPPTSNDLLIHSIHGPKCREDANRWFPGKILYYTVEPVVNDHTDNNEKAYQLVISKKQMKPHHLQLYPISRVLFYEEYDDEVRQWILDPKKKPISTRKEFLIYTALNCEPFRDAAFLQLSKIKPVHQGSRCPCLKESNANVIKVESLGPRKSFRYNYIEYRNYRFCLVMENTKMSGYVSEKMLLAFLGGCIPIYWGTLDVFKIFNAKSFIYYNINKPELAFERVRYLEGNETAYNEVMAEPILANGNVTIKKYFSMSDNIGGGKLKQKIRDLLELG
jgi:hypothetical protein